MSLSHSRRSRAPLRALGSSPDQRGPLNVPSQKLHVIAALGLMAAASCGGSDPASPEVAGAPVLVDVARALGVSFSQSPGAHADYPLPASMGGGVALFDADSDGDLDLYVANDYGLNRFYRNEGDGSFKDVAEELGLLDRGNGMGVSFGDLNNDGLLDVYVANMSSTAGNRILDRLKDDVDEEVYEMLKKTAAGNTIFSIWRLIRVSSPSSVAAMCRDARALTRSTLGRGQRFAENPGPIFLFGRSPVSLKSKGQGTAWGPGPPKSLPTAFRIGNCVRSGPCALPSSDLLSPRSPPPRIARTSSWL